VSVAGVEILRGVWLLVAGVEAAAEAERAAAERSSGQQPLED